MRNSLHKALLVLSSACLLSGCSGTTKKPGPSTPVPPLSCPSMPVLPPELREPLPVILPMRDGSAGAVNERMTEQDALIVELLRRLKRAIEGYGAK